MTICLTWGEILKRPCLMIPEASNLLGVKSSVVGHFLEEGLLAAIAVNLDPASPRRHLRICAFSVSAFYQEIVTPGDSLGIRPDLAGPVSAWRLRIREREDLAAVRREVAKRRAEFRS
jgi:hypothetical protein